MKGLKGYTGKEGEKDEVKGSKRKKIEPKKKRKM